MVLVIQWVGVESSSFVRGGRAGPKHIISGTQGRQYLCVPNAAPGRSQNICNTAGTSLHRESSGLSTPRLLGAEDG